MSDHDQELEDKLERLRGATADIGGSTGFAARVITAAATVRPASRWRQIGRAWWTVPIAAAMAAGALFWAVRVRSNVERAEAAREIEAALSFPAGASVW